MSEKWIIPEKFVPHENDAEGHFMIPGNSPWFSGHFPGMPVFPAIGMLGLVYDTLKEYAAHRGIRLTIMEMKRIRFRQVLGPESPFTVFISLKNVNGASQVFFHCVSGDTKVCDGILLVKREHDGALENV